MKALVLKEDKSLELLEQQLPSLGEGEVLVKLKAASLNHRELWIRKGLYPGMTLPCILGADGAGIVDSIGDTVDPRWEGKEVIVYPAYDWGNDQYRPDRKFRVLGMPDPGTIAEFIRVPIENICEKPKYLSWSEAAALPVASITAYRGLLEYGQLKKGDRVLITGIGGGVAQAGMSFAKAVGAEIYVTSSSKDKMADAVEQGAKAGVNYKEEDWPVQLKELSGGIDVVLDSSPMEELDHYLRFLNRGAKIVYYGSTGSRYTRLNLSKFFLRHIQLIGTAMGSPSDFQNMLNFLEKHEIRPRIYKEFSLQDSLAAFDELSKGQQIGKIVINIDA